jgi:hypothetical protein
MAITYGKTGTVTQRDDEIVQDLFFARYLDTSQIHRLFFGSYSRAKERMRQLKRKGWVDNLAFVDAAGKQKVAWRLTREAFETAAASLGSDERWTPKQLGPERTRHYIATNEVYVALRRPLTNVLSLDEILGPYPAWRWLNEARAVYDYQTPDHNYRHQPDAEVWIGCAMFFIERQTRLSRVKVEDIYDKVKYHANYVQWSFAEEPPRYAVLFACEDRRICEAARRAGEQYGIEVVADGSEMIGHHLCREALDIQSQRDF